MYVVCESMYVHIDDWNKTEDARYPPLIIRIHILTKIANCFHICVFKIFFMGDYGDEYVCILD